MKRWLALIPMAALLPACGGGGGGGGAAFTAEVFFASDKDIDDRVQIYSADASGATRLLSGVTPAGDSAGSAKASPDRSRVAFLSDKDLDGSAELWIGFPGGGDPVKVSGPEGSVRRFEWSPDSTRLAYLVRPTVSLQELYVAGATPAPVKVSGTLVAGGSVVGFAWSPSGARLGYAADQTTDNVFEVRSVLPDGAGNVRLSLAHSAPGFVWSPDGARVAYVAGGQVWTAPGAVAGAAISVSGAMVAGGSVDPDYGLNWSPDSAYVAYVADQATNDVFELYVAQKEVAASAVKVSGTMVAGGDVYKEAIPVADVPPVVPVQWMPDSSFLFYLADQIVDGQVELFVTATAGGASRISRPMAAAGQVLRFAPSPDSLWAAYVADETGSGPVRLLSVQRGTGTVTDVSGAIVAAGEVKDFKWHPSQAVLLYSANRLTIGSAELFVTAPGVAGGGLKISGPMAPDGGVASFLWSLDGAFVFYQADQLSGGTLELFRSTSDGTSNLHLSGPLVPGGDVTSFGPLR